MMLNVLDFPGLTSKKSLCLPSSERIYNSIQGNVGSALNSPSGRKRFSFRLIRCIFIRKIPDVTLMNEIKNMIIHLMQQTME